MLNKSISEIPSEKVERPKLEVGTYPGIVNLLVDLGEHENEKFGKPGEFTRNRMIWMGVIFPTEAYDVELEDETVTRYQVLGKELKFSPNDKSNLVQYHRALCAKDSPVSDLLGAPGTFAVELTSGGNPKIAGVSKPMKGMSVKLPSDATLTLISEDDWDNADDLDLPPFLIEKIKDRLGGPNNIA